MADETRVVQLTVREFRVARAFLFDGASNRIIAQRLNRSEDTVKSQMKCVYTKVHLHDRAELAVQFWSGRLDLACPTNPSMRETQLRLLSAESSATP